MKRIKIGVEDFKYCREDNNYYVDKTEFIHEILMDHDMVNLITRPRRFGKTFGLSSLRYFLENSGNNKELFYDLKISEYPEFEEHCGKYPVIHLTFKGAKMETLEESLNFIYELISDEYVRHMDAINAVIDKFPSRKSQIEAIMQAKATHSNYKSSLQVLSNLLYAYYNKRVVILIDEYDVPLEHAYFNNYYKGMLNFIRALFEAGLKTNAAMDFAVLTGCLRISKESVFTGLNNFTSYSVMRTKYASYFGFTESDVKQMLAYYQLDENEKIFETLKEWYDGYYFGSEEIYNPWSILQYVKSLLDDKASFPLPYWSNTSSNSIIRHLLENADNNVKGDIEELIQGKTLRKVIAEDITYEDMINSENSLWSFLYNTGYLTTKNIDYQDGNIYAELQIPNKEVLYIYENHINMWMKEIIAGSDLDALHQAIINNESLIVEEELNKILLKSISYNDYKESFYHGFLAGILSGLPNYKILSNRESGYGRSDIIAKHISGSGKAIIFEFKYANSSAELKNKCHEALKQIERMKYDAELKQADYNNIIKYGIAFNKKKCMVLSTTTDS